MSKCFSPIQPVTVNMGAKMPAWYDIYNLGDLDKDDQEGIQKSSDYIQSLIQTEVHYPANSIIT